MRQGIPAGIKKNKQRANVYHRGIVCGKRAARKKHFHAGSSRTLLKGCTQLVVGRDTAGNEDALDVEFFRGNHGTVHQVTHYSVLKFTHEPERCRAAQRK